jgi:hypothetical protein
MCGRAQRGEHRVEHDCVSREGEFQVGVAADLMFFLAGRESESQQNEYEYDMCFFHGSKIIDKDKLLSVTAGNDFYCIFAENITKYETIGYYRIALFDAFRLCWQGLGAVSSRCA